jgi:peptidoglycan/xylan/chitin deacetylase (PgdA/CDA1 family)
MTLTLLYHDVVAGRNYGASGFQSPDADIYKLSADEFQLHLEEIATRAPEMPRTVEETGAALFLTFDDGGASALAAIAPLLETRGWRGHFFMTTGCIGKPGFLGEADLRELRHRGHVVGSHSCSHPLRMAHCTPAQLDSEWRDSVRRLEDILGERVVTASVPGGYYSRDVARAAAAAGLRTLFNSEPVTSVDTVDGCRVMGRFCVQQGVSREWVGSLVAGRAAPRIQRYLAWNGKKLLKAAGGTLWLAARKRILARRAA